MQHSFFIQSHRVHPSHGSSVVSARISGKCHQTTCPVREKYVRGIWEVDWLSWSVPLFSLYCCFWALQLTVFCVNRDLFMGYLEEKVLYVPVHLWLSRNCPASLYLMLMRSLQESSVKCRCTSGRMLKSKGIQSRSVSMTKGWKQPGGRNSNSSVC